MRWDEFELNEMEWDEMGLEGMGLEEKGLGIQPFLAASTRIPLMVKKLAMIMTTTMCSHQNIYAETVTILYKLNLKENSLE